MTVMKQVTTGSSRVATSLWVSAADSATWQYADNTPIFRITGADKMDLPSLRRERAQQSQGMYTALERSCLAGAQICAAEIQYFTGCELEREHDVASR